MVSWRFFFCCVQHSVCHLTFQLWFESFCHINFYPVLDYHTPVRQVTSFQRRSAKSPGSYIPQPSGVQTVFPRGYKSPLHYGLSPALRPVAPISGRHVRPPLTGEGDEETSQLQTGVPLIHGLSTPDTFDGLSVGSDGSHHSEQYGSGRDTPSPGVTRSSSGHYQNLSTIQQHSRLVNKNKIADTESQTTTKRPDLSCENAEGRFSHLVFCSQRDRKYEINSTEYFQPAYPMWNSGLSICL